MSDIGRYIAKYRKAKGLTQEQLGTKLHVTRQTVSSWETGRTMPDVQMLSNIAQVLDVSMEQLIYGRDIKASPRDTSMYKRLTVISAIVVILCICASILLQPHISHSIAEYSVLPEFISINLLQPAIYICGSICFLSLLFILGDIVVPYYMVRRILLIVGFGTLTFFAYSVLAVYELVPSLLWIRQCWLWPTFHPYVFVIPGTCLFLGLNRHF